MKWGPRTVQATSALALELPEPFPNGAIGDARPVRDLRRGHASADALEHGESPRLRQPSALVGSRGR